MTKKKHPWQLFADRPDVIADVLDGMSGRAVGRKYGTSVGTARKARNHILATAHAFDPDDKTIPDPESPEINITDKGDSLEVDARGQGLVMTPEDLIRVSGLDMDRWQLAREAKVKTWPGFMKGPDGKPCVIRLWGVTVWLERRLLPLAEHLPVVFKPMPREVATRPARRCAVIVGDPQIGFRRRRGDLKLTPMHDPRALDVLLQVCAIEQPETIVFLGDNLDLAEWSTKYPRSIDLIDTTQPSLAVFRWYLATFRATCPASRIVVLGGNHDARVWKALREKLPVAEQLTPVGDDVPAMALQRLLDLDGVGAEWVPYPQSWWLWDKVRIEHGTAAKRGSGETVTAIAKTAHHSHIQGHIHRAEVVHKRIDGPNGPEQIFVASPGCTARLASGAVPGATEFYNWSQAWAVVWDSESGPQYQSGLIDRGATVYAGADIVGRDQTATMADDLGIPLALDWLTEHE